MVSADSQYLYLNAEAYGHTLSKIIRKWFQFRIKVGFISQNLAITAANIQHSAALLHRVRFETFKTHRSNHSHGLSSDIALNVLPTVIKFTAIATKAASTNFPFNAASKRYCSVGRSCACASPDANDDHVVPGS